MLTKTLEMNGRLIVHLTNAMSDDTEVEIHYSPKMESCRDYDYAPIRRQGEILTLSPTNTPIVLELAGSYRFEPVTPDIQAKIHVTTVDNTQAHGDIMSQSVYTKESNEVV